MRSFLITFFCVAPLVNGNGWLMALAWWLIASLSNEIAFRHSRRTYAAAMWEVMVLTEDTASRIDQSVRRFREPSDA